MITLYENIETERGRIETAIKRFGRTSDHNLDWWLCVGITPEAVPVFAEWPDGRGLLTHRYENVWRIWSDPLSPEAEIASRIEEFAAFILKGDVEELWCDDISDNVYPKLKGLLSPVFKLSPRRDIDHPDLKENFLPYYRLFWPILAMEKYDSSLPGGHFKEMRNARSKFYREHKVEILDAKEYDPEKLIKIVDDWTKRAVQKQKEDVYDLRYRCVIENRFRGFKTARVMVVDGRPVGFNAGYEVPNHPGSFTSIIGIHDYSLKDLGTVLWLEDLEWIKNAGYREFDMQGSEYEWEIKQKTQFGNAVIERKTDTFSIRRS